MRQRKILRSAVLVLVGVAACCGVAQAQVEGLVGRWTGGLRLGGSFATLTIDVRVAGADVSAAMTIPENNIFNQPLQSVRVEGDDVTFELASERLGEGTLAGSLGNGLLVGTVAAVDRNGFDRRGAFTLARVVELSGEERRRFVGDYTAEGLGFVRIYEDDTAGGDVLFAFAEAMGSAAQLHPIERNVFVIGLDPADDAPIEAKLEFDAGENRRASGFTLVMGGRRIPAQRFVTALEVDAALIDEVVRRHMERGRIPGVAVAVVHGGATVFSAGYGARSAKGASPVTTETLFQVGSITKVFTATLAVQLAEAGLIRLDDPVVKHLPEDVRLPAVAEARRDRVTIRRILTHTSGLPRDPFNLRIVDGAKQPYEAADLYAALKHTQLVHEPGTRWSYSNFAYALLGHALSRAAGEPFESLVRARILTPLGMDDSKIVLDGADLPRLAAHHWVEDTPRRPRPYWRFGDVSGNGGVTATVADMARWAQFNLGHAPPRVLRDAAREEMYVPQQQRRGYREGMGLGWWVDYSQEFGERVHHGGEVDGHASQLVFSPTYGVGVVVLGNVGGGAVGALGDRLFEDVVLLAREQLRATAGQGVAFYNTGMYGDSEWANAQLAAANPGDGAAQYRLGLARFYLRDFEGARLAFERSEALGFAPMSAQYMLARTLAVLGERESALDALERAVRSGYPVDDRLRWERELDPLRDSERYARIVGAAR